MHVCEKTQKGADHVKSALELNIIGLALQLVVPVRQRVVPPLQHYAGWHGCTAWSIAFAKGLQHHCTSRNKLAVCFYARA